jgi:hypothetical protein
MSSTSAASSQQTPSGRTISRHRAPGRRTIAAATTTAEVRSVREPEGLPARAGRGVRRMATRKDARRAGAPVITSDLENLTIPTFGSGVIVDATLERARAHAKTVLVLQSEQAVAEQSASRASACSC